MTKKEVLEIEVEELKRKLALEKQLRAISEEQLMNRIRELEK